MYVRLWDLFEVSIRNILPGYIFFTFSTFESHKMLNRYGILSKLWCYFFIVQQIFQVQLGQEEQIVNHFSYRQLTLWKNLVVWTPKVVFQKSFWKYIRFSLPFLWLHMIEFLSVEFH